MGLLLPVSLEYAFGLIVWVALLAFALNRLLHWRRQRRLAQRSCRAVHAGLGVWMLLALLTGSEGLFALLVDHSDAFNQTNISRRWFDLHIEAERNEFGARDRQPFPRRPPENRYRIGFVGDSFTIGHGIDRMEDRFSDRTQAALEAACPGKYTVANLADPGLEVSQIEARIHGILEAGYQLDTVVYVICLNDIEGYDPRTQQAIGRLQESQPQSFLLTHTYLLNWLYYRWVQVTQPGARDYFPHLAESYRGAPWEGMRSSLDALHRRCREHDADLRIVLFPFLTDLGETTPFAAAQARIAEWCDEHEVPLLDLRPVLRPHAAERLTVNAFDAHPNERAHALAAEAIVGTLLDDLLDCSPREPLPAP